MRMIIADASPLMMLARSGLIDVLRVLAGKVIVPEAVWNECIGGGARPGATAILSARQAGHIEVRADAVLNAPLPALGAGEVSAIALAMELGCPVLMDERLGRRVASLHGVRVIGSAAILIAAKERGLIPAVKPVLLDWRAAGYFLSEALLRAVLQRAGEE
jgi:predicted nucleic acid-binding protein